jgi:NAD-dependent dihydropyrimidine dehydrogenase PreA subunit
MPEEIWVRPPEYPRNWPVVFNQELCTGCNTCVEVCSMDVFVPNPEKGKPPIIMFPHECWFGACCESHCPVEGAISMQQPINQRVRWKRKGTGEHFRIGMADPPPPNTRPKVP